MPNARAPSMSALKKKNGNPTKFYCNMGHYAPVYGRRNLSPYKGIEAQVYEKGVLAIQGHGVWKCSSRIWQYTAWFEDFNLSYSG